jgi:hypothetical protein
MIGGVRIIEGPTVRVLISGGLITHLAQYGGLCLVVRGTFANPVTLFLAERERNRVAEGYSAFPDPTRARPQFVRRRFGKVRRLSARHRRDPAMCDPTDELLAAAMAR